jgi:L-threonylcarbamoyladenylate synthase
MKILKAKKDNSKEITERAVEFLKNGGVLIFPTDTIYGLICDAGNLKALEKIFKIKKRSKIKPFLLFVRDIKMAKRLAIVNKKQEDFFKKNWPGKVSVILKVKKPLSRLISKNRTVGLRIPKYKLLNLVLEKFGKPLAQTSVNISGRPIMAKTKEFIEQFSRRKNQPDLIIDAGNLKKSKASKVVDLTKNKAKVLRK